MYLKGFIHIDLEGGNEIQVDGHSFKLKDGYPEWDRYVYEYRDPHGQFTALCSFWNDDGEPHDLSFWLSQSTGKVAIDYPASTLTINVERFRSMLTPKAKPTFKRQGAPVFSRDLKSLEAR